MSKHTPGPWSVFSYSMAEIDNLSVAQADGAPYTSHSSDVADVNLVCQPREIAEANAHLIAAAPEMYETLEWLRNKLVIDYGWSEDHPALRHINDLLCKARGDAHE